MYQTPDKLDLSKINLVTPDAQLYAKTAQGVADILNSTSKMNKTSQLRRFYDEFVMWDERLRICSETEKEAKFNEVAPFIQMIRAKAAYAKGRELVNNDFFSMIERLLDQVKDTETLHRAKLFFEAVIGFKKAIEK